MEITKDSRHQKIIGGFGKHLICNRLLRLGFEVVKIRGKHRVIGKLVDVLGKYLERFRNELGDLRRRRKVVPTPMAKVASLSQTLVGSVIQMAAERAEESAEFKELRAVAANIARCEPDKLAFVNALKHFFRRSGAYLAVVKEKGVSLEPLADELGKALSKTGTTSVRHLVSLPWADVEDGSSTIDAGWFRLRQYTVQELRTLFEDEIRVIFYPESALRESDLKVLSKQWWLEVDDTEELPPVGSITLDFSSILGTLRFTDLPPKVEQALAIVILLGWEDEIGDRSTWWSGLPLGHRATLRESLFEWPPRLIPGDYFDVLNGEPEIIIPRYQCPKIRELPVLARQVEELAKLNEAKFVPQVVFRYLLKAALATGEASRKIDQLINHVIAMDALVGSGVSGGRRAISRRIAVLVGDTAGRDVERRVKDLYDARSALVHGGHKEESEPELSWNAHELLVRATRRTIDFFSCEIAGQKITRDEFLAFLDLLASTTGTARVRELADRWESSGSTRGSAGGSG